MLGTHGCYLLAARRKYTNRSSRGGAFHHSRMAHLLESTRSWMLLVHIVTQILMVEIKGMHAEAMMCLSLMPATTGQWGYDGLTLRHGNEGRGRQQCRLRSGQSHSGSSMIKILSQLWIHGWRNGHLIALECFVLEAWLGCNRLLATSMLLPPSI